MNVLTGHTMLWRIALVLAALFAVLILVVDVAHGQEYPVRSDDLDTSSGDTVTPGERITISGSGFAPGADVVITIESDPIVLGTTSADATGAIAIKVRIPASMAGGTHVLKATGPAPNGGTLILSRVIKVAGSPANAGSGGGPPGQAGAGGALAATGFGIVIPLVVALVLVGSGSAILVRARRQDV